MALLAAMACVRRRMVEYLVQKLSAEGASR